jgi:5-methylcytosine-specific restriction endonuclease McrA
MSDVRLPLGKTCSKCGEWKLFSEFWRHAGGKHGYDAACKDCKDSRRVAIRAEARKVTALLERGLKRCSVCKSVREISDFNRDRTKNNGLESRCRMCRAERGASEASSDPRRCRTCGEIKPLSAFSRDRYTRDGFRGECKDCRKQRYDPEYYKQWEQANREWRAETRRRWRKENEERYKEYYRTYYEQNREHYQRLRRAYYEANREAYAERCRRWREENPEAAAAILHNRRARERGASGRWSAEQWRALVDFYGDACLACGVRDNLAKDHVVPIFLGGDNTIANLQPLCKSCNSRKGVADTDYRDPILHAEFMAALEGDGLL